MCKILCPLCERRVCDVTNNSKERIVIEMKCPQCHKIVRIEFPVVTVLKLKTK